MAAAGRTIRVLAASLVLAGGGAAAAAEFHDADAYATVDAERIVLGNALVERSWLRDSFVTEALADKRTARLWTAGTPDFTLVVGGAEVPSSLLRVADVNVTSIVPRGGLAVAITLAPLGAALPHGLAVTRTVEAYPGVAGFRSRTTIRSPTPLVVSAYWLDELRPGTGISPTIHSFRAGGDWREPGWQGPEPPVGSKPLVVGDPQPGTWRVSSSAGAGAPLSGTAQWMSLATAGGARAFLVLERNDYASSWMSFDGARARAGVELSRDVVYIGPFEEQGHVGNPSSAPARQRAVRPLRPLELEAVFTGLATGDDDEPWQHYRYLAGHRMPDYERTIAFDSNGVDDNLRSTGAKDDLDYETFLVELDKARRMGIETFVFDDGWQARSGDWCPDSAACPEPRWDGTPTSRFRPRFPDDHFGTVTSQLGAGMKLGLWMSPMHFNPSSEAFRMNPQWACFPVSAGLAALNLAEPGDGSNEAGIGTWNPEAAGASGRLVDHVEAAIRRAIGWGARYFKLDFLVWLDCLGADSVDLYEYRESFLAMLDRLIADHGPEVTFQIDETNDYRLFPFESLARGPSWYQNGSPRPNEALHASWVLAPFVPPFALGRNALANGRWGGDAATVDFLMAVALPSHFTFFNDLRPVPDWVVDRVKVWTDYYKQHRADLATFAYPLLDDPYPGTGWTALQPWNPDTGRGFLLVYRLGSTAGMRRIALRNVPEGKSFRLYDGPGDVEWPSTVTSAELSGGIDVAIPTTNTARVIRIEPVE